LCNTHYFSAATVVVRTCRNITVIRTLPVLLFLCSLYTFMCVVCWKILFLRNTFFALIYVRKLNLMSIFKRPLHQNIETIILESRGDACLVFTTRLDRVAVLTFVNSRWILYVLRPAVLPSRRLSVTLMIRNMSVILLLLLLLLLLLF